LIAGKNGKPFPGEIEIILVGDRGDEMFTLDDVLEPTNKAMTVTGELELHGKAPRTRYTRLVKEADVKKTTIFVESTEGW